MSEPTVFIVDDDEAIRDSLRWMLKSRAIASRSWESAEAFLGDYSDGLHGCLVLDIRMEGMSGLDLFDQLNARGCALPVIFLTGHADVPMAVAALKKGAHDFVEKPFNDNDLVDKIDAALAKAAILRDRSAAAQSLSHRLATLSQREREVMDLVLAGKANKIIADDLRIAMRTVEVHRARVLEKMGVRSAIELSQLPNDSLQLVKAAWNRTALPWARQHPMPARYSQYEPADRFRVSTTGMPVGGMFVVLLIFAATAGPGLIGGVMVGLVTAKALAMATDKPLIAINHLEGHALTPRLADPGLVPDDCNAVALCVLLEIRQNVGDSSLRSKRVEIGDMRMRLEAAGNDRVRRLRARLAGYAAFWTLVLFAPFAAHGWPVRQESTMMLKPRSNGLTGWIVLAGILGFKEGMRQGNAILLEPIMKVEVTTPSEYQGDIVGDISRRRGAI